MTYGLRIGRRRPCVNGVLIERFRPIPVACVSDCMMRLAAGGARLRPVGPAQLCGPALTVKTAPGDNLMVHKAIELAEPNDIIVVDAAGDLTNAIIGERMLRSAIERRVAGFIINGAVRDLAVLEQGPIPVFAAGVTHRGPYKNGPGEIHYPIAIDGMVIESGDLILADRDGFVCVPFRDAEAICEAAIAKAEYERRTADGSGDRSWIDATLKRLGCEMANDAEPERVADIRRGRTVGA